MRAVEAPSSGMGVLGVWIHSQGKQLFSLPSQSESTLIEKNLLLGFALLGVRSPGSSVD